MKRKVLLFVAWVCYYIGIVRLFYKINKGSKRIVTFHNVIPHKLLPQGKRVGLVDTENEFHAKIIEIKRFFSLSTDINNPDTLTITFDDGYINQALIAGDILKNYGPAIIFVAGQMLNNSDENSALIVDLLMHWVFLAPTGIYNLNNTKIALEEDNRQSIWQSIIWPAFINDCESQGKKLLKTLDKEFSISKILKSCDPEYIKLRLHGISDDEISCLESKGWEFGWHTYSHYPLSKLSHELKCQEINLKAPHNMKSKVFSYPYGEYESVDDECRFIASQSGYPAAVSNLPGNKQRYDKFFIPRMTLESNKYLLHFELSGLKYFIQNFRFLPKQQ